MSTTPDPAAVEAVRTLQATLAQAAADPTVPVATVEAAAWDAHNKVEAAGGDYLGVFAAANRPG
ncbi:hypothetical protein ACIP6P_26330 [Streptomyces sp. NPDC088729]|uniref:hypothetical protein n=1 Tax=Streptomyces sp. NPDC088729 TaxID=3365876 RepID=UPI00382FFC0A